MNTRFRLRHFTEYRYQQPVEHAHNQIRMMLRELPGQQSLQQTLRISPRPVWAKMQSDFFGNRVLWTELGAAHKTSRIFVTHIVDLGHRALCPATDTPGYSALLQHLNAMPQLGDPQLQMFRLPSRLVPASPALRDFARPFFAADLPVLEGAVALMLHIYRSFVFDPTVTTVATPVTESLKTRRGVCQDFAPVLVGALRAMGLAARYVSGYIETLPPPGQQRLIGADASHAWVSVWCGNAGWQDLDPTNGVRPEDQHLTAAWGRDYNDILPLNGVVVGGGSHAELKVHVDLQRLTIPETSQADRSDPLSATSG